MARSEQFPLIIKMTITTVNVGENGKENAVSLPDETSVNIFNLLDGPSLLRSRLVARQWSIFIEEFILGTDEEDRRNRMDEILKKQWGHATPTIKFSQMVLDQDESHSVLSVSKKFFVVGLPSEKLKVYNFSDVPRLQLEMNGDFKKLNSYIDSSVLLALDESSGRVKVLNLLSGEETYSGTDWPGFFYDKHQKSLIVGNTRVKIGDDGTVSDVQQHVHLDHVWAFSHPLYITWGVWYNYNQRDLWRFEGGQYRFVKTLTDDPQFCGFKFYPAKSAIVAVNDDDLESTVHRIWIWSSNSGDLTYEDDLPVPLPGGGNFVSREFDVVDSAGQLVVLGRKHRIPVVVIYQLDELMAGVVGEPRVWVLDQMMDSECLRLAVDKSSITVASKVREWDQGNRVEKLNHLVMDFWNV